MTNPQYTIASLAELVGEGFVGDGDTPITGIAAIDNATENDITFIEDPKMIEPASASRAACFIVASGVQLPGRNLIAAKNPKLAFALAAKLLVPPRSRPAGIHASAHIASNARVNESAHIGPNVLVGEGSSVGERSQVLAGSSVGDGVQIGSDCVLNPGVIIYDNVQIGDRVILHSGAVIGADGFGYVRGPEGYEKFPQVGTVVIEDDVEIGALTCVDRAALGRTRIGRGSKLDNLVQIAHNVDIGERVVIASQTGISGSTVIEDDAVIGGQVGMGDHARVQSGAIIGSQAGVLPGKIVRPGVWWGIPIQPLDEYKRINAYVNRLPQMREELKELRRQIRELQSRLDKEE